MVIATPSIMGKQEIERLKSLIPNELAALIEIELSVERNAQFITTEKIDRHRCQIQINLYNWQSLTVDLQNLLFWHEVAKIRNGSIRSDRSEYMAIAAGLGIASLDISTQNIGMLAAALLISGLAGFRLYQKHRGEQHLLHLTAADRDAIGLAVDYGYDRTTARELLESALKIAIKKAPSRFWRDRYGARLQVLSLDACR
jgi:Protein of unknown function (DUF3318)